MIEQISSGEVAESRLRQLKAWFEAKWRDVDSFDTHLPVVATSDDELLGGLSDVDAYLAAKKLLISISIFRKSVAPICGACLR